MKIASSKTVLRESKIEKKKFPKIKRSPIYLILDNLKSAYNVGSMFRLADALLIEKMYLCGSTINPPNRKLKTTSRGTERWVPWEAKKSTVNTIKELKKKGVSIMCAELTDESIDYKMIKPNFPVCLVLGREYDGISPEVLELADCIVSLPIYGMTNSLNVSTTGSVILYELATKKCITKTPCHPEQSHLAILNHSTLSS